MNLEGKVVYVAHPYGGLTANLYLTEELLQGLKKKYPKTVFISPLHTFSWGIYGENEEAVMKDCKALLERCDAILLTGAWWHSGGCREEFRFACEAEMPMFVLSEKGEMKTYSRENGQSILFKSKKPTNDGHRSSADQKTTNHYSTQGGLDGNTTII